MGIFEREVTMQGKQWWLALGTALTLSMSAHAAGDPQAGASKNSMCVGCHGIPGYHTAFPEVYSVPKLGGQHAEYIVAALKEYKSGARKHPSMRGIAEQLSDQDMEDLAAYYSAKKE